MRILTDRLRRALASPAYRFSAQDDFVRETAASNEKYVCIDLTTISRCLRDAIELESDKNLDANPSISKRHDIHSSGRRIVRSSRGL